MITSAKGINLKHLKENKIMATVFLNTKLNGTTETLDHLVREDFPTFKEFRTEQRRLKEEYNLAGGHGSPYWSSRSVKGYK